MDEQGEATDGSRLPTWGSHLWRIRYEGGGWEHLLAVPEALIAVSGVGRYIYALGYFDHVLYQYDTENGQVRSTHVGAAGGHISRNFLSDERGHAYVSRLRTIGNATESLETTLVEFDETLHEVAETPIDHYTQTLDDDSHGITGIAYLEDHSMVFATDQGYLYRIEPRRDGPSSVEPLGFLNPAGECYAPSLFAENGGDRVEGATSRTVAGQTLLEWNSFDLKTRSSEARPLPPVIVAGEILRNVALYGSITRDDIGRYYLAGVYTDGGRSRPIVVKLNQLGGKRTTRTGSGFIRECRFLRGLSPHDPRGGAGTGGRASPIGAGKLSGTVS